MRNLVRTSERKLRIPAEEVHLSQVREFITEISSSLGFDAKDINSIKLAVDEGCTNIIRHAYRGVESGFIDILAIVKPTAVSFVLIDEGKSFDFKRASDPNLQTYMRIGKKGGLGIFLMKKLMDDIEYHVTNRGNELWLTKKRPHQKARIAKVVPVRVSLRWKVTLAATFIFSAILVSSSWKIYNDQEDDIRGQILMQSLSTAQQLSKNAWGHIINKDDLELASLAKNAAKDNELIQETIIVDNQNKIYGHSNPYMIFEQYSPPPKQVPFVTRKDYTVARFSLPNGEEVYQITTPIYIEGEASSQNILGSIIVRIPGMKIQTAVKQSRDDILLFVSIIFMFGNIGILFLVYILMMPFKKLAAWVRGIGEGTLEDSFMIDSDDDLGEIAEAFNDMASKFRFAQSELVEKEKLQQEIEVAKEIQHMLLPRAFPEVEGYEIASFYKAAKEVGGDYFDFVWVDKDILGIAIADVSGKGVPGSLVMTMIRTALRLEARGNKSSSDVLVKVNEFVSDDIKKGMFITMFYLILDSRNRIVNYSSAGHNPVILYRSTTRKSYYLNPEGFPVGISVGDESLFEKSIMTDSMRLIKGDFLIAYTDGVTEAMNPDREQYGEERFLDAIRRHGNKSVKEFVKAIQGEISEFTRGHPQNDDITLLAIQEKLSREEYLADLGKKVLKMVEVQGMKIRDACREIGISTSSFYKYRGRWKEEGFEEEGNRYHPQDIAMRHMSIEDQAKLIDIVKHHPEYGVKRITNALATDRYDKTVVSTNLVYRELKRLKLNTVKLRRAFVERSGRGSRRLKPPGTPLVTIDGRVITEGLIPPRAFKGLPKPQIKTDLKPQSLTPGRLPGSSRSDRVTKAKRLPPPSPLWPGFKREGSGETTAPQESGDGNGRSTGKTNSLIRTIPLIYRKNTDLNAFVDKEVSRTLAMGKKILIFDLGQLKAGQVFDWNAITSQLGRIKHHGGQIFLMNVNGEFDLTYRKLFLDRVIRKVKSHQEAAELAEKMTAHDES